MGNYKNIETEFIERTLELISQYDEKMQSLDFEKQFNHTLLINCLLGIIVLPKEKTISYLPTDRITEDLKREMGIGNSTINKDITDMRSLIVGLRHSISHFDIQFNSNDDDFLIDKIVFLDNKRSSNYIVATFLSEELLNFIRYYGGWVVHSINKNMINEQA
ncbi:HEPN family nuclease [Larkinella punicea]|uniref:pEK499-p136 HEPN domain-containing protein n=1 Tax=Larkinella punicea TaxID=2315727 RepID=A0A368JUB5_9BACT|nr:HEPN family nuclease [Larkinella punicea]RCR71247.1 hypothetical protein DUE52_03080 [Larkinella punicea]